jgi:hypothetical protein
MIAHDARSKRSHRGAVGEKCRIENVPTIVNVSIGPGAHISGALELREGTIASRLNNPSRIGPGVIARHFILASGAELSDRAQVEECFIGQGTVIGKGFSAENCAFFANCEAFNGEAVSVFAGPYTVTHHKSTLLIAGLFSFFNAGSAANQSNHAYKLGPLHQGALLRGCKMASAAYICWPAVAGPFSVVSGKHYTHFDLTDLPFSHIREHEGKTMVLPGLTLASSGTRRDAVKWPGRDKRHPEGRLDQLHHDLFSPYVMSKVLRGLVILEKLKEEAEPSGDFAVWRDVLIPRRVLDTSIHYYRMALDIFQGDCLSDLLETTGNWQKAQEKLAGFETGATLPDWVDMAGLLTPVERVNALLEEIAERKIQSEEELRQRLEAMSAAYPEEKQRWFAAFLKNCLGENPAELTPGNASQILKNWAEARMRWNALMARDAEKEFADAMQMSYGLEGDADLRARDFRQIRGEHKTNAFVQTLQFEMQEIDARLEKLLGVVGTIQGRENA